MKVTAALVTAGLMLGMTSCDINDASLTRPSAGPSGSAPSSTRAGASAEGGAPEDTESTPPPAPQSYRGRGDKILRIKEGDRPWLVKLTHTGSANFIVSAIGADSREGDSLVNVIGGYKGTVLLQAEEGDTAEALKIQADGAWTIRLIPPSGARRWIGDQTDGKGDEVIALDAPTSGLTTMSLTHAGSANFVVQAYTQDGIELLVNEIGRYKGEVLLPDGTFTLVINADGKWTLSRS